jgi:hypothetical protein
METHEYGLDVLAKQRKGKGKENVGTAVWNMGIGTQEIRFRWVPQVEEKQRTCTATGCISYLLSY